MPDPIVQNEIIKNLMDAWRIFSQEMNLVRMKKMDLVRSILARIDAEKIAQAEEDLKNIRPYAQS